MNLYQAFGGNPVNFTDPWGEQAGMPNMSKTNQKRAWRIMRLLYPRIIKFLHKYGQLKGGYIQKVTKALFKKFKNTNLYTNDSFFWLGIGSGALAEYNEFEDLIYPQWEVFDYRRRGFFTRDKKVIMTDARLLLGQHKWLIQQGFLPRGKNPKESITTLIFVMASLYHESVHMQKKHEDDSRAEIIKVLKEHPSVYQVTIDFLQELLKDLEIFYALYKRRLTKGIIPGKNTTGFKSLIKSLERTKRISNLSSLFPSDLYKLLLDFFQGKKIQEIKKAIRNAQKFQRERIPEAKKKAKEKIEIK